MVLHDRCGCDEVSGRARRGRDINNLNFWTALGCTEGAMASIQRRRNMLLRSRYHFLTNITHLRQGTARSGTDGREEGENVDIHETIAEYQSRVCELNL